MLESVTHQQQQRENSGDLVNSKLTNIYVSQQNYLRNIPKGTPFMLGSNIRPKRMHFGKESPG